MNILLTVVVLFLLWGFGLWRISKNFVKDEKAKGD
jgi:hypothetical protein